MQYSPPDKNKIASRFPQTRRKPHIVIFNLRIKFNLINKITKSLYLPFSLQHALYGSWNTNCFINIFVVGHFCFVAVYTAKHATDLLQVADFTGLLEVVNKLQQVCWRHQLAACWNQTCCKLTFADLLQVDETTCVKSADVNLQQAW